MMIKHAGLSHSIWSPWARWTRPPEVEAGEGFTYHRSVGYGAVLAVIMVVGMVEVFAVHLVVERWSTNAAWLLTVLSLYSLVWLLRDYQAIRRRPILLTDDGLDFRIGLRWRLRVPWEAVAEVRPVGASFSPPKQSDYLHTVVLGSPRYLVELEQPLVASGPYGIEKHVTMVGFTIDDRAGFEEALKRYL